MTTHQRVLEQLIRRHIQVQRFGGSQVKKALPILRQMARDLRKRIESGAATEFQAGRLAVLEQDIQLIVTEATQGIQGSLDLDEFAEREAQFTHKVLGASISADLAPVINSDTLKAVVSRKKMRLVSGDSVKNLTLREAFDEFAGSVSKDAMRVVQAGVLEGRTQQQMARDVAGLVTTRCRRQAETVVRTATNHIGGIARNEVYAANADLMDGERVVATLDGRTTLFCMGQDSKIYPIGQGPQFPAHYGCRTLRVPQIKEQYRAAPQGERASMDGPVSNQVNYSGFLRRQSKEFQDDVLGPKRAQLFRSGEVKIDRFTDDMGRTLTLDELAAREGLAID